MLAPLAFIVFSMVFAPNAHFAYEPSDIAPAASTPVMFVDALKQSTPWSSALPLALDDDGDVVVLLPGQTAQRLVYARDQQHPSGDYALLFDGMGSFDASGGAIVARSPGRLTLRVSSTTAELRLRMTSVDPRNPARNLRLILPGFIGSYANRPFLPEFVQALSRFGALRFAVWSHAAASQSSQVWTLRPRVSRSTQVSPEGVAPEYEIALANETGADPWFALPSGATDAYVFGVADLAHRFLDPRLHPIFEYGDAVTMGTSGANAYARMAAQNLRIPGAPEFAAQAWYALRSRQVFGIVDRVFGLDASRVLHASENGDGTIAVAWASGQPGGTWQRSSAAMWRNLDATRAFVRPLNGLPFLVGDDDVALSPAREERPAFELPAARTTALVRASRTARPRVPLVGSPDPSVYHYDLARTGWDSQETILNTANVATSLKLVNVLQVTGDVLAQPLYVSQYPMPGLGKRNILLVATEHDVLDVFDADSGALLAIRFLGAPQLSADVGCLDVRPNYGITSTPAIDRAAGTIYVVAATENPAFHFHTTLHALDIATLKDKVPPVEIAPSTTLSNGQIVRFDPQNQYARTSLVWANGSLYVGIGSHCDANAPNITGWLLRFNSSLQQTAQFATVEDAAPYMLSSIWMSGFAAAVDGSGSLFVVTGNGAFDADHHGKNYGESVLKLGADLQKVTDYFTPIGYKVLNRYDIDFGSGGIMLLPPQQASVPDVAVTVGKISTLYLLNQAQLGTIQPNDAGALEAIAGTGGGVWGGPAYYDGPSGQFVYTQSDSAPLLAFAVVRDQSNRPLLQLSSMGATNAAYGGSFPIVSSNGQVPGTGIVWVVRRTRPLQLEAYDATNLSNMLFHHDAGTWLNPQNNGFISPLVANGKVYVPASSRISIFGLGAAAPALDLNPPARAQAEVHQLYGTVARVAGNVLMLRLRDGRLTSVDITLALAARHIGILPAGGPVAVYGVIDNKGRFHAENIGHASPNPANWGPDN